MAETLAHDAAADIRRWLASVVSSDSSARISSLSFLISFLCLSRLERLSLSRRGEEGVEEAASAAAAADSVRDLRSEYEEALQVVDAQASSVVAALGSDDLDAFMEWLRKEVSLAEEENHKLSGEICSIAEITVKDTIQLDVDIAALGSSLKKIDTEGLKHLEASQLSISTDSCRNQANVDKDYKYELLELGHQLEKSEKDLKLLEIQSSSLQKAEAMWELESMFSEAKILDFKDNCLRVFLKAPVLDSESLMYGHKLDCSVNSNVSDHELLIEVDEGSMEPKKVQIFPDDICVDILFDKLKSSREVISAPSLGWLIRQFQYHIVINTLRRSLVNDANNSRHSFEYFDKNETMVAHLAGGMDAFIKISADWPLSSYGLKLISIHNSGAHSTDITSIVLCKTKELANGLELQTRRHLVTFVDAIEDILLREMRSRLHSSNETG
ncbi:hypothetical protein GUJ93_ZPchr0004g38866 [Zizania palustris]|uniref:Uncharacterized protein n=1 Tax=Zizania palustris TaxID=103762 RepID=A0A8J5SHS7_ZIZPA|nr:hypothetical protein GUJ93_ZPchr0004g38866 [Zizania palustris]